MQESGDPNEVKAARDALAARLTDVRGIVNEHYHSVHGIRDLTDRVGGDPLAVPLVHRVPRGLLPMAGSTCSSATRRT